MRSKARQPILLLLIMLLILGGCGEPGETPVPTPAATPTIVPPTPTTAIPPTSTVAPTSTPQPVVSLAGTWIGGYQLNDELAAERRMYLHFTADGTNYKGEIRPSLNEFVQPLEAVTLDAGAISFEWLPQEMAGAEKLVFKGEASGGRLFGTVTNGTNSSDFSFAPYNELGLTAYSEFAGTYQFASGRTIGFYETAAPDSQVFASRLLFSDLQTGDMRASLPVTGTTFVVGSAAGLAFPFYAEVTFERDNTGAVTGLRWTESGKEEESAVRMQLKVEEVSYPALSEDGVTLAGRLTSPTTPGKHPAVVLVHGAGAVGRKNWLFDMLSGFFGKHGIATLSYDKRGVGESGGNYVLGGNASESNLKLLGSDALASVNYLKARDDIDVTQIGMQGNSQAGWIIPIVASQTDISFMVIWSGPTLTVGISDLYDRIAEDTDPEDIREVLARTTPFGFDPLPYLQEITSPGFWAYGGSDMIVPTPESMDALEELAASGKDYSWQLFPRGHHFLLEEPEQTDLGLASSRGYVAGLFEATSNWVQEHVRLNR